MKHAVRGRVAVFAAVAALSACASGPRAAGGDGLARNTPVVIMGTTTAEGSRAAMHAWIAHHYPGARLNSAGSTYVMASRLLYLARLDLPGGNSQWVYFDLSGDASRMRFDMIER